MPLLPRDVHWYADPAGANEIEELRKQSFTVSRGKNALRSGIAAVTSRLRTGRLRVLSGACPNLLSEAELYRYSAADEVHRAETPVDEHNHALAALRYLVTALPSGGRTRTALAKTEAQETAEEYARRQRKYLRENEECWKGFI
jgi:hypothetical protein